MTIILNLAHDAPETVDVALIRRSIRAAAAVVGATALDDIELVAAELVANAVVHGTAPLTVTVALLEDAIRLEVVDRNPEQPLPDHEDATMSERGRGLVVVAAIASQWGWNVDDAAGFKTVWAELRLHADESATT